MNSHFFPAGFTILEILIVLGILSSLIFLELSNGTSSYVHAMRRTDQELLVSAIRKARSDAIQEVCERPNCSASPSHGVFITRNQFTLFEGSSYSNRYVPADLTLSYGAPEDLLNATSTEVVFASVTGNLSANQVISVTGPDHSTESISINTDGMISP